MNKNLVISGKRKTSVATIFQNNSHELNVNGKKILDYFHNDQKLIFDVMKPLVLTSANIGADIRVQGGGLCSQASAIRYAISKLLSVINDDFKAKLSQANLLHNDTRQVERKKVGKPKARKDKPFNRR